MSLRQQVLSLYRKIIRLSKVWVAQNPSDTAVERRYIKDEARTIFRKNKDVNEESEIKQHIQEAEARMEIALHYRIPYPRPMNLPQTALPPTAARRKMKKQDEILKTSKSIYLKSLYDKYR